MVYIGAWHGIDFSKKGKGYIFTVLVLDFCLLLCKLRTLCFLRKIKKVCFIDIN